MGECFLFQLSGITVVSPGGNIPPFETKTSVQGDRKEMFCLWIIDNEWCHSHSYPLISEVINPGYQRNSTIYWMLIHNTHNLLDNLALALQGIAIQLMLPLSLQEASPPFYETAASGWRKI